jgi:cation diffusion facilitator family transporter
MNAPVAQPGPRRWAVLSIAAAIATMAIKLGAWKVTGSVGLLSDAIESGVNLMAALVAFWALTAAVRPADEEHRFGHSKAEYFSSAFEGLMILLAAVAIVVTAVERLKSPQPLEAVWLGLAISCFASAINGGVAVLLFRAGKRYSSVTLTADAHHLLTDVWTSGGVLVGVVLVKLTGWLPLDPLVAIAVAINILWTAIRLLRASGHGLLDQSLPSEDQRRFESVLARYQSDGVEFHAVRTRVAGARRFVEMHVLVPGGWTVRAGHDVCEAIEREVIAALPRSSVITHLEPVEDPASFQDQELDRAL